MKPLLNFWATGLALAAASALLRFWALSQTPFANGWDSYFYLVQLKSLEETGRMHSPEASLIYPYLRFFYWLTGDYVSALKSGTAVLAGLFTIVVFWSAENRRQNSPFALCPLLLASWSVFSPHLTYFAAQYPKNLLGAVLLMAFIGSLARVRPRVRPRVRLSKFSKLGKSWWIPTILLSLNYFAHRLTFALAVVYLVLWLFFQYKNLLFKTFFSKKNLLYGGVALGLFAAASQIFPGLFHFADLGRLSGVLTWKPQFAPWSFVTQFGMERISGWWLAEVILVTGYWLLVVGCRLSVIGSITNHQSPVNQSLLWLCALLLFPFLEWSFTSVAWRFFLVFVLATPLLVIDFQLGKSKRSGLVFVAFALSCSLFSWKSYNPEWHDPDYARFAEVTEQTQQLLANEKPELLIAHNALAEYFTFTTGTDAMPWLPEYAVDSSRLWRIAAGVKLQTLRYYAGSENEASVLPLGRPYCLLPEHAWQAALRRARAENDEVFLAEAADWRNPSRVRPGWLLHRKRGL